MRLWSLVAWCGGAFTAAVVLAVGCSGSDNTNTASNNDGGGGTVTAGPGGAGGVACTPETEVCDNVDNDCDDEVDEDCPCSQGDMQPCYTGDPGLIGIGVCAEGTQSCDIDGVWGSCDDEVLPVDELCDGDDNDCNNETDEGFGIVTCGVGACQESAEECIDGVPNPCIPGTPNPVELCDTIDDDCDTFIDEGCLCTDGTTQPCYNGSLQTQNVGECHDGLQTCSGGMWGVQCVGEQLPVLEVCDGLDNDCSGADDNGDPGGGAVCDTGMPGVCGPGTEHCVGGTIECVQNVQPSADICDGLDNDCNPGTADGAGDGTVNVACDGADTDLCTEGVTACVNANVVCGDATGDNLDLCNGMNDDCDPASADGSEDPQNMAGCDGGDTDLCIEGNLICNGGGFVCSDNTGSTIDICNNADDDCDPASANGSEDPLNGQNCDGNDTDLCTEGTNSCVGTAIVCSDVTGSTVDLCNSIDDDCDSASANGSEDPLNGTGCDGTDGDLCNEGTFSCVGTALQCSDNTTNNLDVCNGMNDDCDGASADGSEDPQNGASCDGADTDLCNEGTLSCVAAVLTCSDVSANNGEPCNGLNDDCNSATPDGSTAPWFGMLCDGSDTDLCTEGTFACTGGVQTCGDTSGNNVEICNNNNDDCNGATADGSGETWFGQGCDGNDGDFCNEGTFQCTAGAQTCSDVSATNPEICNGSDDDCDSSTDEGNPGGGVACGVSGQQGPCANGTTLCTGGALICNQVNFPVSEAATVNCSDTVDNDCDGTTDASDTNCCPHNMCTQGEELDPVCGGAQPNCINTVCANDPFCCTQSWDGFCISEINTECFSNMCSTCSHNLCVTGGPLTSGCDGGWCVQNVCAADPFCCSGGWDSLCVQAVATECAPAGC